MVDCLCGGVLCSIENTNMDCNWHGLLLATMKLSKLPFLTGLERIGI